MTKVNWKVKNKRIPPSVHLVEVSDKLATAGIELGRRGSSTRRAAMTVPQDSASLIQILAGVLLPQPDERTRAEKLLGAYGPSPGFLVQLAGVGLDTTQSMPVRQMSWVFARQLLLWGDRGEDEKGAVKRMLLGGLEVRHS